MGSLLDHREGGQERVQIEPQMALRRGLAPSVLRPAHAVGNQRDGAGIDRVDRAPEAPGQSVVAQPEPGAGGLEVAEHLPEELFHHVTLPDPVGVGEGVAGGGHRPPDRGELPGVVAQPVTHVIEADGMGELGVEQGHDLAPRAEGPGFFIDAVFAREFGHEMPGNELAYLAED